MQLVLSLLVILSLHSKTAFGACPGTVEDVAKDLIDLGTKVGLVRMPPESQDFKTVYFEGREGNERIFLTKFRSAEKYKLVRENDSFSETWFFEEGCLVDQRKSPSSPSPRPDGFDDQDLQDLLAKSTQGLIYLWSPSLPLSVEGKAEIQKVATGLNLPVTFLVDPTATANTDGDPKVTSQELLLLGATRHYPALLVYQGGKLTSLAHVGRRSNGEWKWIINQELKRRIAYQTVGEAILRARRALSQLEKMRILTDLELTKLREYPLEPGFGNSAFFQVTPFHNYVLDYSYITQWQVHLIDQLTGKQSPTAILGGDPYPSPDGRFFVSKENANLSTQLKFYSLKATLENPSSPSPFHTVSRLGTWWYSSVGWTKTEAQAEYDLRVLTREDSMRIDRYRITAAGDEFQVTELGSHDKVCANTFGSGPILSRDGRYLNSQSDSNTHMNIYRLPEDLDKPCDLVAALPFYGSKIAWHPYNSNQFTVTTRDWTAHYLYDISQDTLIKFPSTTPECASVYSLRIIDDRTMLFVCSMNADGTRRKHVYYQFALK